jgi:hypothetical protein
MPSLRPRHGLACSSASPGAVDTIQVLHQGQFVPDRDAVKADQGDRWLGHSRAVDGAGIDGGDAVATALVEPESVDVVVRRHQRDAWTAGGASSSLDAIQQRAADAATGEETVEAQDVPALDSWFLGDESDEVRAVDRDKCGQIGRQVDGVADDHRLAAPAVAEHR